MNVTSIQAVPTSDQQPDIGGEPLDDLSLFELVEGILLFLGPMKFPEQGLLQFFRDLQVRYPALRRRLGIVGEPGDYRSTSLRSTLSFMEMYKVLELPPPNPVDQYYRIRPGLVEAVRRDLRSSGALPKHHDFLNDLASEFRTTLSRPSAR